MNNKEIIESIKSDLKELYKNDFSGHDYNHTLRVYNNALLISENIDCDKFKLSLIALLHDADDVKVFDSADNENARKILKKYNIDNDVIEAIIDDINNLSFKGDGKSIPSSIEGKISQDADRLDAIGAIGIARCFQYGGKHNRIMYDDEIKPVEYKTKEEYHHNNSTTINHFYEKLFKLEGLMNMEESRKIAHERTKYMKEFISEFNKEIKGLK